MSLWTCKRISADKRSDPVPLRLIVLISFKAEWALSTVAADTSNVSAKRRICAMLGQNNTLISVKVFSIVDDGLVTPCHSLFQRISICRFKAVW